MKKKTITNAGWLALSGLLVLLDQASKRWAQAVLEPKGTMALWNGVVGFRYAENTGAAFSAFSGATLLLGLFSLAVCVFVAVWMLRDPQMGVGMMLPLSMILAGGVGNLIDRLAHGYVVDFLELQFMKFAIFNVADICITVGAALLFIALLRGGEKSGRMDG